MGIDPAAPKPHDLSKLSNSLKDVVKRDAAFSLECGKSKTSGQLEYPIVTKLVIMGKSLLLAFQRA